jgi:hypothetical protein
MPPKRETSWTIFVKDWAKGAGVSYPCASTDPRCRADYEAYKVKMGMKPSVPRKATGAPKRKYVRKDPNAPVVVKRKYVRKPKVDKMALSYIMNPMPTDEQTKANRAAASARVKAMKAKKTLTALPEVSALPMIKTTRKYAPRKKREPTAAEFISAVARLNANPSLMEWSKG